MSTPKPYEIEELDRLGKEGKLWNIDIYYNVKQEACRMTYYNKKNEEVMRIREAIFRAGFVVPVKDEHGVPVAGSYRVVPPLDIIDVFLNRQSGYFKGV